jgi:hypothetical protein
VNNSFLPSAGNYQSPLSFKNTVDCFLAVHGSCFPFSPLLFRNLLHVNSTEIALSHFQWLIHGNAGLHYDQDQRFYLPILTKVILSPLQRPGMHTWFLTFLVRLSAFSPALLKLSSAHLKHTFTTNVTDLTSFAFCQPCLLVS